MLYHIRFAFHLWRHVLDMTLWQAWTYPHDQGIGLDADQSQLAE